MADIACDICFRSFNDNDRKPRNLPCGHVYCSKCLSECISRGSGNCSTCRSPYNASTVSDLPVNFYIMKLVEQPPITDKPTESSDDFNGGYCPEHKSSYLYFVCKSHNIQICRECTVIQHNPSNCDIVSFKDQIEQRRSTILNEVNAEISLVTESITHLGNYERSKSNDVKHKSDEIKRLLEEIDEDKKACDEAKKAMEETTKIQKDLKSVKGKLEAATKKNEITESCSIVRDKVRSSKIWIEDLMKKMDFKLSDKLFNKNPACFLRIFSGSTEKVYIVQQSGSIHRSAELKVKDGMIVLNALHMNIKPKDHAVTIQVSQLLDLDYIQDNIDVDKYTHAMGLWESASSDEETSDEEDDLEYIQKKVTTNVPAYSSKILQNSRIKISKVYMTFVDNSSYDKQVIGTVYIAIEEQALHAKQFLSLFTGTQGYSYKGITQVQAMRDNTNATYAISNNYCLHENGRLNQSRLFSCSSNNSIQNEKNNVCVFGNCGFVIFHKNPPTNQNYEVVGSVISGLEVISKVADIIKGNVIQSVQTVTSVDRRRRPITHSISKLSVSSQPNQGMVIIDEVGVVIQ